MTVTVTVASEGRTITIDADNVDTAVAFVNAIDRVHAATTTRPKRKPRKKAPEPLSPKLAEALEELRTYGGDDYTPSMLGAALAIPNSTANWRLKQLVEKGLATKTGRGTYAAVTT